MTDLPTITQIDGVNHVDSRLIAWECGVNHRSAYRMLVKFQDELESELGTVRFQIAPSNASGKGGDGQRFALLSEVQATALITLFRNTLPVVRFKIRLAKAFALARKEHPQPQRKRHIFTRPGPGWFPTKYPLDALLDLMGDRDWGYGELREEAARQTGMCLSSAANKIREGRAQGRIQRNNGRLCRATPAFTYSVTP